MNLLSEAMMAWKCLSNWLWGLFVLTPAGGSPGVSQLCTQRHRAAQETILDLATLSLVNVLWLPRAISHLTKASPSSKSPRIEILLLPVHPEVFFSGLMMSLPTPDTLSCMNCKKQGWKCTGCITHIQEATGSMKLCSRCGISSRDWGASFKHDEVRCRGRCTKCRDLGLDCEKITGGGCQSCKQANSQEGRHPEPPAPPDVAPAP